jgi:hypothetical protein
MTNWVYASQAYCRTRRLIDWLNVAMRPDETQMEDFWNIFGAIRRSRIARVGELEQPFLKLLDAEVYRLVADCAVNLINVRNLI